MPPRGVQVMQGPLGIGDKSLEESLSSSHNTGEILIVLETLRYSSEPTLTWRKTPRFLSAGLGV